MRRPSFVPVPDWALAMRAGLSPNDLLVLGAINAFADPETMTATMGARAIATRLRCDRKTVRRSIAALAAANAIRVRTSGASNTPMTFTLTPGGKVPPPRGGTEAAALPPHKNRKTPNAGAPAADRPSEDLW